MNDAIFPCVTALSMTLAATVPVTAAEREFQQGLDGFRGTSDADLDSGAPDSPTCDNGTVTVDFILPNTAIIRFLGIFGNGADQIPYGSCIASATLTLQTTSDGGGATGSFLHRMLLPFEECDTWNGWEDGIQADDVEALAIPDAAVGPVPFGGTVVLNVTETLQAWSNGDSNHGWAIIHEGTSQNGWIFKSSEDPAVGARPMLSVSYQPGCQFDLDGDCDVDFGDILQLIGAWGLCTS